MHMPIICLSLSIMKIYEHYIKSKQTPLYTLLLPEFNRKNTLRKWLHTREKVLLIFCQAMNVDTHSVILFWPLHILCVCRDVGWYTQRSKRWTLVKSLNKIIWFIQLPRLSVSWVIQERCLTEHFQTEILTGF